MTEVHCKQILYGSEEYQSELALRDLVLRRPLGLSIENDDLRAEGNDLHIGAFCREGDEGLPVLAGVLVLTEVSRAERKMRQVAVAPEWQGKGVGRQMVAFAERCAKDTGAGQIVLHARKTAVPFYEKLGYCKQGEPFYEVTIEHIAMKKRI